MKLHDHYTTSAIMHFLNRRYGMNPHGIKTLLGINTKTYQMYLRGHKKMSFEHAVKLVSAFGELAGRIEIETEKDK